MRSTSSNRAWSNMKDVKQERAEISARIDELRIELAHLSAELSKLDQASNVDAGRPWASMANEDVVGASNDVTHEENDYGLRLGLPKEDVERYCRQMLMPKFGVDGQKNLRKRSILVIGAGGLGCPAALYIAAAGVGRLGIVDRGDHVDRSNLHRQIAHSDASVGVDKAVSLADAVRRVNPHCPVYTFSGGVSAENVEEMIEPFDIILDCTDNVQSRYMINDACAVQKKPLVSGSAIGFEGQLTVYGYGKGAPCYRCIFPSPPPPACVGSCDTAGVLGPVPGVIGTLQAMEALKIAAGLGDVLTGRLLLLDAMSSDMRTVRLRPNNPRCVACGQPDSLADQIKGPSAFDYYSFTLAGTCEFDQNFVDGRLSAKELVEKRSSSENYFIDVRPKEQFDMCALNGFSNVPFQQLSKRVEEIKASAEGRNIIVICRRGNDSARAVSLLRKANVGPVCDVRGGLQAWKSQVDPNFPEY